MKTTAVLACLASSAFAVTTWTVTVGGSKAAPTGDPTPILEYTPETVVAAANDVIEFHFLAKNHTATQSSFGNPCVKMEGGFDSNFMPNPDGKSGVTATFTVPDTKPVWMYCKQKVGTHCGKGMVFAVNPPTTGDKTFAAFKQLAISQNGTALSTSGIVGTAPPAAASTVSASAAATAGAPAGSASVVAGQGTNSDGSACSCSCLCGANSFPATNAQNNFGGYAGMLPSSSAAM